MLDDGGVERPQASCGVVREIDEGRHDEPDEGDDSDEDGSVEEAPERLSHRGWVAEVVADEDEGCGDQREPNDRETVTPARIRQEDGDGEHGHEHHRLVDARDRERTEEPERDDRTRDEGRPGDIQSSSGEPARGKHDDGETGRQCAGHDEGPFARHRSDKRLEEGETRREGNEPWQEDRERRSNEQF